jgi:t-SNARE complex subunit (syntaxin)
MAVRSVIMHEIRSSQIQVSPKEYELIYKRMCNNMEVMKEMEEMVKEQGENIDKVNDYIDSTYQNV